MFNAAVQAVGLDAARFSGLVGLRAANSLLARARLLDAVESRVGELPASLFGHAGFIRGTVARLDKTYTIDQAPEWWSSVRKELAAFPASRVRDLAGDHVRKAPDDFWSKLLAKWSRAGRSALVCQRVDNELSAAAQAGWFLVFDTLTIAPNRKVAFLSDPNSVRDYTRRVARAVWYNSPRVGSVHDWYRYFAVPEYGEQNGRLHFHIVHMMRVLPGGCVDPNACRKVANLREIRWFKRWPYGVSSPIAVRFSGDAFTRIGWRWPVDKNAVGMRVKPLIAVVRYVTKYVQKDCSKDRTSWPKHFRQRSSRGFGMVNLTRAWSMLSHRDLLVSLSLHRSVTRNARLYRLLAKRELSWRLARSRLGDFLDAIPDRTPLLVLLRGLTDNAPGSKPLNFGDLVRPTWDRGDISDALRDTIEAADRRFSCAFLSGK